MTKTYILERKELLRRNKKAFFSHDFERAFNEANNTDFLEDESPTLTNY